MIRSKMNYKIILPLVNVIVDYEASALQIYEDLMILQPNNMGLLRNYARLLKNIYRDDDTAESIWKRADKTERSQERSIMEEVDDDYEFLELAANAVPTDGQPQLYESKIQADQQKLLLEAARVFSSANAGYDTASPPSQQNA
jgi:hypothetical protein